jgi:hypothetical protein
MRKQMNMSEDVVEILDYFAKLYAPKGLEKLTYPQTVQIMADKLGMKKNGNK